MLRSQLINLGAGSRADQVAQGLVLLIGHPDWREITAAQQAGELEGVASIRLYLVTRSHRDQRRRDHQAVHAQRGQLTVQRVPGRPG